MKTCETTARRSPSRAPSVDDSTACADYRYIDLKSNPARIRTSLQDFVPWSHYAAIDEFYGLVEWLNWPLSPLESNDCSFTGPHANDVPSMAKALECSGRVMVLFRALTKNLSRPTVDSFKKRAPSSTWSD